MVVFCDAAGISVSGDWVAVFEKVIPPVLTENIPMLLNRTSIVFVLRLSFAVCRRPRL